VRGPGPRGREAKVGLVVVDTDEEAAALLRQPEDPGGRRGPLPISGAGAPSYPSRRYTLTLAAGSSYPARIWEEFFIRG
jgi:hypothetical protein